MYIFRERIFLLNAAYYYDENKNEFCKRACKNLNYDRGHGWLNFCRCLK